MQKFAKPTKIKEFSIKTDNSKNILPKNKTLLKSILIFLLISGICLNCTLGLFFLPDSDVECINDVSHNLTENWNKYLNENIYFTNTITIVSSLCIDIIILSVCFTWIFKSNSWRFLVSLFFFYTLRGFTQNIFQMRYPDGFLWSYPGLPSLAVSYFKTNDFFFSGHVGMPIIVACELFKNKK